MSLDKITAHLANHDKKLPPVESWNPPYCGEIDIEIKANGDWYHEGDLIKRLPLTRMFASVLIKEVNKGISEYFLITPVEKVKIKVEDAPFVLTHWHWLDQQESIMQVSTNLGDEFILDAEHPIVLNDAGEPYVTVRRNLTAKVHRNVFYQWADISQEQATKNGTALVFSSADCQFTLGSF